MVIVTNVQDVVMGCGDSAERVNAQDEKNLIRVSVGISKYYIGTVDRDKYNIIEIRKIELPKDFVTGKYLYIDGSLKLNPDYIEPINEEF